jgi:hypothetical protein
MYNNDNIYHYILLIKTILIMLQFLLGLLFLFLTTMFTSIKSFETNPFRITKFGWIVIFTVLAYSISDSNKQNQTNIQFNGIEERVNTTDEKVSNIDSNVSQISKKVDMNYDSLKLTSLQNTNQMLRMRLSMDSFSNANAKLQKRIVDESKQRQKENNNLYNMFDSLKSGINIQNKMADVSQSSNVNFTDFTFEIDLKDTLQRELKYFISNSGRNAKVISSNYILMKTDKEFKILKFLAKGELIPVNVIVTSSQSQKRFQTMKIPISELKNEGDVVIYNYIKYQDEFSKEVKEIGEVSHYNCTIKSAQFGNNPTIQKIIIDNLKSLQLIAYSN